MAIYEVEAPDGRILEIEGSQPPTESELNDIFKSMNNTNKSAQTEQPIRQDVPFEDLKVSDFTRNMDLTPSGIFQAAVNMAKAPDYSRKNNIDILNAYLDLKAQTDAQPKNKVQKAADIATTFALPELKLMQAGKFAPVVNRLLTGGYQGGLIGGVEGLSEGRGLKGAAQGAATGAALTAGLPPALKGVVKVTNFRNKLIEKTIEGLSGVTSKTRARAVQPDSVALDLTEDEAQQLLTNTTERVRNIYNQLLDKKGRQVGELLEQLPDEAKFNTNDILAGYSDILDNYSLSGKQALNPARNVTQKEMQEISNMLSPDKNKAITAKELYDINKNVSNMTRWDMPDSKLKNNVLEQIYGQNAQRISDLSPELKSANKEYENLMNFQKNEGLRRILKSGDVIDNASSTLKNYNSSITKGNTNRNIQDLENLFVEEGHEYEPFLGKIDDVNAAQNLLSARVTGDSSLANVLRIAQYPGLLLRRKLNRSTIPQKIENFKNFLGGLYSDKLITPALYGPTVMLKGGVRYNEPEE